MAYIDKTASRLPRRYDISNIEEFIAIMESNNPFDSISMYFFDQSYRRNEEELNQDRENGDGRYDRRALTLDMLSIRKEYNPEYQDRYISRGRYYATMDWPFVPKDKEVLELDDKWNISLSGIHSSVGCTVHHPKLNVSWETAKKTHLVLRIGDAWEMRFPKEQLIYVYGCHQNAYDRNYRPPEW